MTLLQFTKYNPATYFKDHLNLVCKWKISEDEAERNHLEKDISQLDTVHLNYIVSTAAA